MEKFCSIIQNHNITFAYVVPPTILLLSKHPVVDKYNFSSLKMLNSGAAPLTRELVDAVYERLKVPVKQGYGLSETSPTTHTQVGPPYHLALGVNHPLTSYTAMGTMAFDNRRRRPHAPQPNRQIHVS